MKWIKTSERLPNDLEDVLIYLTNVNSIGECEQRVGYKRTLEKNGIESGFEWVISGGCCACSCTYGKITHWMPLPLNPD